MPADPDRPLQILLHAPTQRALARARSNAANLMKEMPSSQVRIIANADAVSAALDEPDAGADPLTWLCTNTLRKMDRQAQPPMQVLPSAAALMLARMQCEGWIYIHA